MRVGFILTDSPDIVSIDGLTSDTGFTVGSALRSCGGNLGNLAFKKAAHMLIEDQCNFLTYGSDAEYWRSRIDILVMAEANLINHGVDYSGPADFVSTLDKPCLMLGVGAQAKDFSNPDFSGIPEGTRRFLQEVSKRSYQVLVRGKFSKTACKSVSIHNAIAAGCPSYLLSSEVKLWSRILDRLKHTDILDGLVITEGVYSPPAGYDALKEVEQLLFEMVAIDHADYVGQMQGGVIAHGLNCVDEKWQKDTLNIKNYLCPRLPADRFLSIARRRFKSFIRIDKWLRYLEKKTACIGTRVHGNLLALQSGTPAVPLTHDSRSSELCEFTGLPYFNISQVDVSNLSDFLGLFDIIRNSNARALDDQRIQIARIYYDALKKSGIRPSDHLKVLSQLN